MALAVVVLSVAAAGCGGSSDDDRITADDLNPPPRRQPTTANVSNTAPTNDWRKVTVDPSLPRQDIDVNVRYPATFTKTQIAVVQTWANFEHVGFVVADPPAPGSPLLKRFATSEVAAVNASGLTAMEQQGLRARLRTDSRLEELVGAADVADTKAVLVTCRLDDSVQVNATTGSVVNNDRATTLSRVHLVKLGGSWKVSPPRTERLGRWSGLERNQCEFD